MASLVPGLDTVADLAAIPVDLMRGDYMSALFDFVGVIPGIGEAGDTAKLARMGIKAAETADDVVDTAKAVKTADNVIDAARAVETADDIADTARVAGEGIRIKTGRNVGELAKPYPKENIPEQVNQYLTRLPKYGDTIEVNVAPSFEDISLMSRQEAVEFASITVGNKNYILRGDLEGTPIPKDILDDMVKNKGILNCHSHPYIGDFRPSKSDLWIASVLSHQKEFKIITPDGMQAVYNKEGIISIKNIERNLKKSDMEELYKLFGGI